MHLLLTRCSLLPTRRKKYSGACLCHCTTVKKIKLMRTTGRWSWSYTLWTTSTKKEAYCFVFGCEIVRKCMYLFFKKIHVKAQPLVVALHLMLLREDTPVYSNFHFAPSLRLLLWNIQLDPQISFSTDINVIRFNVT